MVRWKFGGDINVGFLAILELQIRVFFKTDSIFYGGYFLVREKESNKKCGAYKNKS